MPQGFVVTPEEIGWIEAWLAPGMLVASTALAAFSAWHSWRATQSTLALERKKLTLHLLSERDREKRLMHAALTPADFALVLWADWNFTISCSQLRAYMEFLNANETLAAARRAGLLDDELLLKIDVNHGAELPLVRHIVERIRSQRGQHDVYVEYLGLLEWYWKALPTTLRDAKTTEFDQMRQLTLAVALSSLGTSGAQIPVRIEL